MFRSDIEGLRGIAVLVVVAFHCGISGMSGGFVGVDVFFVLSGYLITGLLVKEISVSGRLNLLQFYARRARRLLPAAALVSVVTLGAGAILLSPWELTDAARAARATSVYLSNMYFALNSADYFARDVATNPMLHTWSLAVEEQFYLIWPILIVASLQFFRSTKALVAVLLTLTVSSLVASVRLTETAESFAFYGLPTRAWEFGLGGLAVLLPRGVVKVSGPMWNVIGWLGVLTILGSAHFISEADRFPGWIAMIPVLGTVVALIVGAEQRRDSASRMLAAAPLQFIGRLSYSWYLWHWPFLVFATGLFPTLTVWGRIVAALMALGVAIIAHRLVENPLRFHPALVRRPGLSLALGAILMGGSLGAAMLTRQFATRLADSPAMRAISTSVTDSANMSRQDCVSLGTSAEVKTCTFGSKTSAVSVVLLGDSHAIQWFNALRKIAERREWALITMVKSGCPAADVGLGVESCAAWRRAAFRRIQALQPSILVVGSSTGYITLGPKRERGSKVSLVGWKAGTRRTLVAASSAAGRVLALRNNPEPGFDVPSCLARSVRHAWYPAEGCQFKASDVVAPAIFEAEQSASADLSGVEWIDFTNEICRDDRCRAVINGVLVYRDDNHLSDAFAESLSPIMETHMVRVLSTKP